MSPTDQTLTIGEVARRAGLRRSAIRYYESIGLLPHPPRVSGQRCYEENVFKRLAIIDVAQRAGLSLDEARTLLDGFSPTTPPGARWRKLAEQKLPEIEQLIARAITMKRVLERGAQCECVCFEDCELGEFTNLEASGGPSTDRKTSADAVGKSRSQQRRRSGRR